MMETKRRDLLIASVFIGLAACCCTAYTNDSGQATDRALLQTSQVTIYDSVPDALRPSLIARLNLFLKYRIAKQWEGIYSLLAPNITKGKSKSEVVEGFRKDPSVAGTGRVLVDFLPKKVVASEADQEWFIYGCARLSGITMKVDAFIIASREADEWRFSDVDMLTPRDTTFKRCAYDHEVKKTQRTTN